MNDITIKKLLNSYKHEKVLIKSLQKEIERINALSLTERNLGLLDKLQTNLNKSMSFIKIIEDSIDNLPQPFKNVLYFRYIKDFSYEKISLNMNYSIQRIYQLHKEGIQRIFKVSEFFSEKELIREN